MLSIAPNERRLGLLFARIRILGAGPDPIFCEIWLVLCDLHNQMIHEYMEDLDKLTEALYKGHEYVSTLTGDATRILVDLEARGWIAS
ncbi:MAG TPA: hypothetical protein PK389_03570 [Gammaproteobacteria bacterium]|nr:hypothetical protein [Gammaproteobacteria bacterium]